VRSEERDFLQRVDGFNVGGGSCGMKGEEAIIQLHALVKRRNVGGGSCGMKGEEAIIQLHALMKRRTGTHRCHQHFT
jgi:hypothetical protein